MNGAQTHVKVDLAIFSGPKYFLLIKLICNLTLATSQLFW